ncbi:hypothetical protein BJ944DRAFT_253897, partial [Cunninghamella echinulata]
MIQPLTSSSSSYLNNNNDNQKEKENYKPLHRRKSLPYKSPPRSPYNRMIFKMDVYHRPPSCSLLYENNNNNSNHHHHDNLLLSTFLPSSLSSLSTSINNIHSSSSHIVFPSTSSSSSSSSSSITSTSPELLSSNHSFISSPPSSPPTTTKQYNSNTTMDKPKADTTFYDHINLSIDDNQIYDPLWIPSWKAFDQRPNIRVVWKGSPLSIHQLPYYHELHPNECSIASTLRLSPEQYLKCKRALIL